MKRIIATVLRFVIVAISIFAAIAVESHYTTQVMQFVSMDHSTFEIESKVAAHWCIGLLIAVFVSLKVSNKHSNLHSAMH